MGSEVVEILGDDCGREGGEGGDLVLRRTMAEVMEPPSQIFPAEELSPRGFWGRFLEIRFL